MVTGPGPKRPTRAHCHDQRQSWVNRPSVIIRRGSWWRSGANSHPPNMAGFQWRVGVGTGSSCRFLKVTRGRQDQPPRPHRRWAAPASRNHRLARDIARETLSPSTQAACSPTASSCATVVELSGTASEATRTIRPGCSVWAERTKPHTAETPGRSFEVPRPATPTGPESKPPDARNHVRSNHDPATP